MHGFWMKARKLFDGSMCSVVTCGSRALCVRFSMFVPQRERNTLTYHFLGARGWCCGDVVRGRKGNGDAWVFDEG